MSCAHALYNGRFRRKEVYFQSLGVAPVKIFGADNRRVALLFGCQGSAVQFGDSLAAANAPLWFVGQGVPTLILRVEEFGDLVMGEIWGRAFAGSSNVSVISIVDTTPMPIESGGTGAAGYAVQ